MKVLLIGHEALLNGASRSLVNIVQELIGNHEIYVMTPFASGPVVDELKKYPVHVVYYPYFRWCDAKLTRKNWFKKRVFWYLYEWIVDGVTALRAARFVRREKIDIIHSNTGVINIGALISRLSGCHHVWHLREFGDLDFSLYPLVTRRRYVRVMNRCTDYFICISKAISEHYTWIDPEKKVVIYNGVDQAHCITRDSHADDCVDFLISGRIGKAKGQQCAVDACRILLEKGKTNFHLSLCGQGSLEEPVPDALKPYISELGVIKDMPALRKGMDVELVCSKAEAFGRVTAEAMMGGMPVIGSNTGGTTELIRDGETGFLFEQGNAYDLADKMAYYMEQPKRCRVMGEKARAYAMEHFTIERCVKEIVALYERCLDQTR